MRLYIVICIANPFNCWKLLKSSSHFRTISSEDSLNIYLMNNVQRLAERRTPKWVEMEGNSRS
nr:MAG TPA: hypothetical protein [Caudoviricetes sp.]